MKRGFYSKHTELQFFNMESIQPNAINIEKSYVGMPQILLKIALIMPLRGMKNALVSNQNSKWFGFYDF